MSTVVGIAPTLMRWVLLGSPLGGINAAAVNVLALAYGPDTTTMVTELLSAEATGERSARMELTERGDIILNMGAAVISMNSYIAPWAFLSRHKVSLD